MDESAHPIKPDSQPPTNEVAQLLKMLELQSAAHRGRSPAPPKALQGVYFRYGSLIAIIIFALGSVGLMEWIVSQFPKPVHTTVVAPVTMPAPSAKSGNP